MVLPPVLPLARFGAGNDKKSGSVSQSGPTQPGPTGLLRPSARPSTPWEPLRWSLLRRREQQPGATDRRSSAKHPPRTPRTQRAPPFRQIGSPIDPFSWATSPMCSNRLVPRCQGVTSTPSPSCVACTCRGLYRVLRKWWHRGRAHCRRTCHAHCKSGIHGMASQRRCSSSNRLSLTSLMNSNDPIGVPNTLTPCGLQTSGPKSTMLGKHLPF